MCWFTISIPIEQAFTSSIETEHDTVRHHHHHHHRHPLGRDMSTALLITPHRRSTAHRLDPARFDLPRVVSATSLSAHAEVRSMVRPSVPNYALRRAVVATAAAVALVVGMLGLVGVSAGFSGAPASAAPATQVGDHATPTMHVARSGDTLWSIANTYRGDVDRDRFIDALITLNGGVTIQAGQAVRLP